MNRKTIFETTFFIRISFLIKTATKTKKKVDLICMKINVFPLSSQSMFITGKNERALENSGSKDG